MLTARNAVRCFARATAASSSKRAVLSASAPPSSLARSPLVPLAAAMSTAAADKKFYLLQYEYVPDILEKRGPFRPEHLERATAAKERGSIVMGGALVDPPDGALFIFKVADKQEIDDFAKEDPYVKNGLVPSYSIREWMVVIQ